jgi:hypothetical protein
MGNGGGIWLSRRWNTTNKVGVGRIQPYLWWKIRTNKLNCTTRDNLS